MKTYYAEKMGIDPKDMVVVSVMPCTAKKYEIKRPDMEAAKGLKDIDVSITTRELGEMIKRAGLDFVNLPDEKFDPIFGIASGAGDIFGASGGVMEAALRTVSAILMGDENAPLEFHDVRGLESVKEATYELPGQTVRVAVVSGTKNAGKLLEAVRNGEKEYDFIEVMCCPGGCINGGGQPTSWTMGFKWRLHHAAPALCAGQCEELCGLPCPPGQGPLRRGRRQGAAEEPFEPHCPGGLCKLSWRVGRREGPPHSPHNLSGTAQVPAVRIQKNGAAKAAPFLHGL